MDTTENDTANHDQNSYFEAFAGIVAALDALAKAVTPDGSDDGTPPEEMPAPECNSYFASFKAIEDALARVREAVEERRLFRAERLLSQTRRSTRSPSTARRWRWRFLLLSQGRGARS